jgi:hypothetical protein
VKSTLFTTEVTKEINEMNISYAEYGTIEEEKGVALLKVLPSY